MGVRFLIDDSDHWPVGALYDSVTGTAFGPLFEGDRAMIRDDVWDWMHRTCAALPYDARRASFDEIRNARDRTRDVPATAELGGEG